jgi:hypothetical protein
LSFEPHKRGVGNICLIRHEPKMNRRVNLLLTSGKLLRRRPTSAFGAANC